MSDSVLGILICSAWAIFLATIIVAVVVLGRDRLRWLVPPDRFDSVKGWLLFAIAVATVFLALLGHLLERRGTKTEPESTGTHVWRSIYQTAQIVLLNDGIDEDNVPINMARLGSVAMVILVAAETLRLLFADSFQRMLLSRQRGHIIVCGLGQVGTIVVRDLLKGHARCTDDGSCRTHKPPAVVVVESDRQTDNLDMAGDAGAVIVYGDATDEQLLKRINATAAEAVFFVTGSDEDNLEGAVDLLDLCARQKAEKAPKMYLHLRYDNFGKLFSRPEYAKLSGGSFPTVVSFNVVRSAAIDLVTRRLLPYRPKESSEVAHFVIVGFGAMGREIVRLIAELGHFENRKRSRMTVFYSPAEAEEVNRFRAEFPALFPATTSANASDVWQFDAAKDDWSYGVSVVDPKHVTSSDHGIEFVVNGRFVEDGAAPMSPDFMDGVMDLSRQCDVLPVIILCNEVEEKNCTLGRHIRDELNQRGGSLAKPTAGIRHIPVFAYVPRKPLLTKLAGDIKDGLILFGACHEVCSYEALTFDVTRPLADAIAQSYDKQYGVAPKLFVDRTPWEQYSNLATAAHVQIKLAKFGWEVVGEFDPRPRVDTATIPAADEVIAAEMEHNRWVSERLMTGWRFGPRDNASKHRDQLVPWALLNSGEAAKDYDQVRTILEFCNRNPASAGKSGWNFKLVNRPLSEK